MEVWFPGLPEKSLQVVQICFDDDLVCKYDCDADTNHEYVGVDDDIDVVVLIVLMTTMMVIMKMRRRRMTVLANSQGSLRRAGRWFRSHIQTSLAMGLLPP